VQSPFSVTFTAAASDIDELGHVSNLVYLRWVLEVALAHSIGLGWDHAAYRTLGGVFVVRRHEIDYVASVTEGQEVVASTWVDDWRQASCIRKTELVRDGKIVAKAATTWAFVSFASGRPQRIPDPLRATFGEGCAAAAPSPRP
jgi:acyl-CoA thioester hydrolase